MSFTCALAGLPGIIAYKAHPLTYWLNGKYVQKEDAYLSPLTHTLHYGLGAFEGVRSYEAKNGEVNIFRLKEHTERLFESAKIINVPIEFSFDEVMAAQLGVIQALMGFLQGHEIADSAEIIAQMQIAGRLHTRQHTRLILAHCPLPASKYRHFSSA